MRFWCFFIQVVAVFVPLFAEATTLIVTHPERVYDRLSLAGPATRRLLEDPSFRQKIVLFSEEDIFTFSTLGLSFVKCYSAGGELKWDGFDSNIVLAGGYWQFCAKQALIHLITQAATHKVTPLEVKIHMDATYAIDGSTLTNLKRTRGDKKFIELALTQMNGVFYSGLRQEGCNEQISAENGYKLELYIDGRLTNSIGTGHNLVKIIYE